jgi:hypothetical protein
MTKERPIPIPITPKCRNHTAKKGIPQKHLATREIAQRLEK